LNGKFILKRDLDNEMTLKLAALNFQGNQYKQMFDKDFGKFCDVLYDDKVEDKYNNLHKHFEVKVPWKTCPYPKGPNEITNFMIDDFADQLPPYLPGSEKWQIQVRFLLSEEVLGGYNVFAIIRTEKSLMNGR
jgi:hypothetical protein